MAVVEVDVAAERSSRLVDAVIGPQGNALKTILAMSYVLDRESDFREAVKVRAILTKQTDLRWDDAIRIVLDATALEDVRAKKREAKKKSGDFTDAEDGEEGGE